MFINIISIRDKKYNNELMKGWIYTMNKNIAELLDAQVNKEFYSAYLYLDIAKFFAKQNLFGFASWYRIQAKEEQEHAMKIYDYLLANGQDVTLGAIEKADTVFENALAAVKAADEHEHYITGEINTIYDAAVAAHDYRTQLFLNWFITEQEEEEENSAEMVYKVTTFDGDAKDLYLLDKEVGKRQ